LIHVYSALFEGRLMVTAAEQFKKALETGIGHGKVMSPATRDRDVIVMYLEHMAFKVAVKLRRYNLSAHVFSIGLKSDFSWIGNKYRTGGVII